MPSTITAHSIRIDSPCSVRALVLDSVSSPHSRRAYARALDDFRSWSQGAAAGLTRETVQRYRAHLEARGIAPSTVNLHLTVLRQLAREAATHGILAPDTAVAVAGVKGARAKGRRPGNWLNLDQAHVLLNAPAGDGLRAQRDRALLALLVGCGLRTRAVYKKRAPFGAQYGETIRGRYTAAFLIYKKQMWGGGPDLLCTFGLSGTMNLVWAYLLRTRFPDKLALDQDVFRHGRDKTRGRASRRPYKPLLRRQLGSEVPAGFGVGARPGFV